MRVLFVVPYPLNQAASQRYRVEQWLPLLDAKGIRYKVAYFWSENAWQALYKPGHLPKKAYGLLIGFAKRLALLPQLRQYDYVVIHREATPVGPPWFEWLAAKVLRRKIIYDFDDAIWLTNLSAANEWANAMKWPSKTAQICRWSHKVSCGNGYLQQFALQYNASAVLLPSVLDTDHCYSAQKEQHTQEVVIGWIGSHSTLPYLQLIEPVLQRLEQKYSFRFVVIADQPPMLQLKSLVFKKWKRETEVQELLQLHIGLMPLPDTEWAKGKCGFKALQYMALGIPAVVSAVGANVTVVADGHTGYTCSTVEEWQERLEHLLLHADSRASIGAAGRKWVRERYSLQAQQDTFLSLFAS
ncbi:glycosyltransferase family 4 protein [Pontibacter sp. CAU 1760]